MIVIRVLLPLVLILGLGFVLGRKGFFTRDFVFGLNRLVYFIGLPCLILHSLSQAELDPAAGVLVGAFTAVTLCGAGLAWGLSHRAGWPAGVRGAVVQGAFRGNLAYVAIPVLASFYHGRPGLDRVMTLTLLTLGPAMVLFNVLSVLVLRNGRAGTAGWRGLLHTLALNPLILASFAGMVLAALRAPIPGPLSDTLGILGDLSVPAALLCVGAVMGLARSGAAGGPALVSSAIKVGLLPLLAWGMARILGLDGDSTTILCVLSACPTAVASYIMAVQMGADEDAASQGIVFSTVLSLVPLAVILATAG